MMGFAEASQSRIQFSVRQCTIVILEEAMRRARVERRDASAALSSGICWSARSRHQCAPVRAGSVEDIPAADKNREIPAVVIAAEGATLPNEGVAARAGDIKAFWVHGYNQPASTDWLVHWTEGGGLLQASAALDAFAAEANEENLRPAPLLKRQAGGTGFFDQREAA